jgi:hypothetical protein
MFKRIATAAIGVVFALPLVSAQANPYYGYDGRHFGELKAAPDFSRSTEAQKPIEVKHGGGQRRGLTPAMLALLDKIEAKFGPVNVISGYRPGARIAGTGRISRHASGNAADIEVGSRKGAIVNWLIANHHSGGTMTYADMSHIHVDIGQHFVSLGAYSGGGGRRVARSRNRDAARYAEAGYSRRYAGERRYRTRDSYAYGYGYARDTHGQRYASGYATIY